MGQWRQQQPSNRLETNAEKMYQQNKNNGENAYKLPKTTTTTTIAKLLLTMTTTKSNMKNEQQQKNMQTDTLRRFMRFSWVLLCSEFFCKRANNFCTSIFNAFSPFRMSPSFFFVEFFVFVVNTGFCCESFKFTLNVEQNGNTQKQQFAADRLDHQVNLLKC